MQAKQPTIAESFRLTVENSQKLEALKQSTGQAKNEIVNQMIQEWKSK